MDRARLRHGDDLPVVDSDSPTRALAAQETLFLLSVPGLRESVREEMATPLEDCSGVA